MNRKQQGDLGVAMAIAHYTRLGHTLSVPLTENARYDLIVDTGRALLRVQVKTTGFRRAAGNYVVHLQTCGGNRSWQGTSRSITAEECDRVFVYVLNGASYDLPAERVAGKRNLVLSHMVDQYRVASPSVLPS